MNTQQLDGTWFSGAGFALRPMQPDDLDEVTDLEAAIAAFPWNRGHFADCLKAGYSVWVVRRETRLAAYAVLMMVVDESHLLNIGVAEAFQRQGIGRQLLVELLARTRRAGAGSMLLEVRPSNERALRLYRQFGFSEIGRRKGYYPNHIGREDALVLRCPADQTAPAQPLIVSGQ